MRATSQLNRLPSSLRRPVFSIACIAASRSFSSSRCRRSSSLRPSSSSAALSCSNVRAMMGLLVHADRAMNPIVIGKGPLHRKPNLVRPLRDGSVRRTAWCPAGRVFRSTSTTSQDAPGTGSALVQRSTPNAPRCIGFWNNSSDLWRSWCVCGCGTGFRCPQNTRKSAISACYTRTRSAPRMRFSCSTDTIAL